MAVGSMRKSEQGALEAAGKVGYPVIIKASAGGGGRGMRVVNKAEDLARAFQAAQAEAKTTFGNDAVYLERYFLEPRHIEVQIIADHRGHVVHLGERDCSIQRRHQKLLEETPSPAVDEKLRREICRVAVEAVKAVHYRNVGTVEFLLDKDHNFFFMEVNTRIQVEHAITEMVTGIDLIKEQIRLADGQSLSFKQQLLMPTLNRAVTFAEMHNMSTMVGNNLHFDMARLEKISFEIDRVIAESGLRLRLRGLKCAGKVLGLIDDAHAAPSTTG